MTPVGRFLRSRTRTGVVVDANNGRTKNVSTTDTTHPKYTIPRSSGTWRPVKNLRPGWWVHLEPEDDAPEGTASGYEQINLIVDYHSGFRTIRFAGEIEEGGANAITVHKLDNAVTLTEREAAKLGLRAEEKGTAA